MDIAIDEANYEIDKWQPEDEQEFDDDNNFDQLPQIEIEYSRGTIVKANAKKIDEEDNIKSAGIGYK